MVIFATILIVAFQFPAYRQTSIRCSSVLTPWTVPTVFRSLRHSLARNVWCDRAGCTVGRLAVPFHGREDTARGQALTMERT